MAERSADSGRPVKLFGKKSFIPDYIGDLQVMCSWGEGHLNHRKHKYHQELWVIPSHLFDQECREILVYYMFYMEESRNHWISKPYPWYAKLTIQGRSAIFDDTDGESRQLNKGIDGEAGCIEIVFADDQRTKVGSVKWTGDDEREFSEGYVCSWCPEHLKQLSNKGDRAILERLITVRLNQQEFRDEVIKSCAGKCCVTGNSVLKALDAAHITSFSDDGLSDSSNGILLRADIHRLFDRGLLAIEPRARSAVVRIDKDLRASNSGYAELHEQEINVPVEAVDALKRHYELWRAGK